MARVDRRYARLYFDDLQRDYPAIWADDVAFATWVRLLAGAEASWPSPAILPRSTKGRVLRCLVDATLIEVDGDTYRVKGLDAERTARQTSGRRGANARWGADADAFAHANASANGHANASPNADANGGALAMPHAVAVPVRERVREREGLTGSSAKRGARAIGLVDPVETTR